MTQDFQKILLSGVLLFSLVFGMVFFVLESRKNAYEGSTTLVLIPKSELTETEKTDLSENVYQVLSGSDFTAQVADARYRETEEWQKFSIEVKSPAALVFALTYSDASVDPYAVREALSTVRTQSFLTVSRLYDISRDVEIRFLDRGIVSENVGSTKNMLTGGITAFLAIFVVGGIFFWSSKKEWDQKFQKTIQEKIQGSAEPEKWWEKFQQKSVPDLLALEKEDAYFKESENVVPEEETMHESETAPERVSPFLGVKTKKGEVKKFPAIGSAPANLPIVTGIPKILRPDYDVEEKTAELPVEEESVVETPAQNDPAVFENPITNPEPSAEELKERLNKLLRGELG